MNEWVNVTSAVKRCERSVDWKSALEMQVYSSKQILSWMNHEKIT